LATEREAILEEITPVIRSLCEMCEALHEQLTEVRWRQLGTSFDTSRSAYHALKQWEDAERARIETGCRSRDDQKEQPFEVPPLHTLRVAMRLALRRQCQYTDWIGR
jgi:hypothetical protein